MAVCKTAFCTNEARTDSGYCALEPEGWEDSPIILADRAGVGTGRVAAFEARARADGARVTGTVRAAGPAPTGKRWVKLPTGWVQQ